ncbi:MAG: hypothetical protein HC797_00450 [Anaerolineales bacterium]|nr:hypothetical protein [Anaerolineales bacterium]
MRNTILDANTGEVMRFELLPTTEQYIVGLNGLYYARFENRMTVWEYINGEAQPRNQMNWSRTAFFGFTDTLGVFADGSVWLHFNSEYEDSTLLWLDKRGNMINRARFAYRPTKLAGIDEDFIFYICGNNSNTVECAAVPMGMETPKWTLPLENGTSVAGLALVPERLYVASAEGFFYAIGNP